MLWSYKRNWWSIQFCGVNLATTFTCVQKVKHPRYRVKHSTCAQIKPQYVNRTLGPLSFWTLHVHTLH